ncbi:MAG: DUF4280 domain-containing protein [Bacteroidetes bacterium]|nr:MAG: DUF4280 domain-containing protein [Bacteroidota bacterium]
MPQQVCMGAMMTCSFGVTPCPLVVIPENRVFTSNMPAATIMDFVPEENIATFGMCSSILNPEVEAATTAALGVLTPMPCVPATVTPWVPGTEDVLLGNIPSLNNSCTLTCLWGGEITFTDAGQVQVEVS